MCSHYLNLALIRLWSNRKLRFSTIISLASGIARILCTWIIGMYVVFMASISASRHCVESFALSSFSLWINVYEDSRLLYVRSSWGLYRRTSPIIWTVDEMYCRGWKSTRSLRLIAQSGSWYLLKIIKINLKLFWW